MERQVYDGTEIVLYLPDGLSVAGKDEAENTLQGVTLKAPEEGENNWTFCLDNTAIPASSDTVGSFQVAIHVEDNGVLETNHVFDFQEGAGLMEISTSITIKDRTDPNDVKDGVTYEDITVPTDSTFPDLKSATDDQWHISKSQTGTPAVDEDKNEITFSYTLTVGLLGQNENGEPIVVSDPQSYARLGRVPFATDDNTISLTEIPTVNDREGNPLTAKSITITPQFDDLEPIIAEANDTVELPVDTCQGNVTGSDVDGLAPYYSQYGVEVVYDYDKFEAEYYDEDQDIRFQRNKMEAWIFSVPLKRMLDHFIYKLLNFLRGFFQSLSNLLYRLPLLEFLFYQRLKLELKPLLESFLSAFLSFQ